MSDTNRNLESISNTSIDLETFPVQTQSSFYEFLSENNMLHFRHNVLYNYIVQAINSMGLVQPGSEKYIIYECLKMLSDGICPMYLDLSTNINKSTKCTSLYTPSLFETDSVRKIPDYIANPQILNKYFQTIRSLMMNLGANDSVKILLKDFKHYCIGTDDSNTDLEDKFFTELDKCELSFVEVIKETRTDRFNNCSGTIVMFVHNPAQSKRYYLIFDVLNKRVCVIEYHKVPYNKDGNEQIEFDDIKLVFKRNEQMIKCGRMHQERRSAKIAEELHNENMRMIKGICILSVIIISLRFVRFR